MRQQHLFTPLQSTFDRQKYIFKPSFLRIYSLISVITILFDMIGEIISPIISTAPAKNIPLLILAYSLFLLVLLPLSILVPLRSIKIVVNKTGIIRTGLWHRPIYIDWDDMILVKSDRLKTEGVLHIQSITSASKTIELSWLYDLSKMLIATKKFTGNDRPLTIALEKEVLLPRQNPAKMLWRIIIGIIIILSIWLIGGNLYADYREKPLNQAIANYVHQHPKIAPNQAAIDLQASVAKLGIPLVGFGDGSKATVKPDNLATQEWKTILPILDEYVPKQLLNKTEDLFSPPPTKLHAYLNSHQAEIAAIQNQLASNNLPSWGSDSGWIEHSDFNAGDGANTDRSYSYNMFHFSRLLIANIFDWQLSSNRDISRQLNTIKNLNHSIQNQPGFYEQIMSTLFERDIYKLFRHFELTPLDWKENLSDSKRIEMTQVGIEHELLFQVRLIQDPKILMGLAEINNRFKYPFIYLLKYHHIARPYTRLMAVDYYQKSQQSLLFWRSQNICRTSGYNGDTSVPDGVLGLQVLSHSYITFMTNELDRELTSSIRQIKSPIRSGESIDRVANEFKLASQVCLGEGWLAKVNDGTVTIFLSHPPNWTALGLNEKNNTDRLTYKINPKSIKAGF